MFWTYLLWTILCYLTDSFNLHRVNNLFVIYTYTNTFILFKLFSSSVLIFFYKLILKYFFVLFFLLFLIDPCFSNWLIYNFPRVYNGSWNWSIRNYRQHRISWSCQRKDNTMRWTTSDKFYRYTSS